MRTVIREIEHATPVIFGTVFHEFVNGKGGTAIASSHLGIEGSSWVFVEDSLLSVSSAISG